MKLQTIPFDRFQIELFSQWSQRLLVLCAGDYSQHDFNMMTVGWGSFGVIWGKPFSMVMVRPQRQTFKLIEAFPTFTLTSYPADKREIVNFCGSKSGRDFCNKAAAAGMTPIPSKEVAAPGFAEAELIVECKKSYFTDMKPEEFLDPAVDPKWYAAKDYHRIYFGEILHIEGTDQFIR